MAAAGYDAVSMGNHEFDYSFDALLDNMKVLTDAGVKVIDANVINKGTGKSYFDANAVFELTELK